MTWLIVQVWFTPKMKLSYKDLSHRVQYVMKTMFDYTREIYIENKIELS